jgi:8-oxo-dGTP pyrophosphatase MutT (NUDIX family)
MTCQKHKTCKRLASLGVAQSAGVAAVLFYRLQINDWVNESNLSSYTGWVMGVGRERSGNYQGQYNLCAGKGEKEDNSGSGFCWLMCAKREFREEFKISTSFGNGSFDDYFKSSTGQIRVFVHQRTPIFVALLPDGTSRRTIKSKMRDDNSDSHKPWSQKEMDDFEWIRTSDGRQLEGQYIQVTSFADAVRRKIDVNNL